MATLARTVVSSIGAKSIMAVTGLALVFFVIAHLIGNLQIFLGAHAINTYAHFLQSLPELLWAMRAGLLAVFVLHVLMALHLTLSNWRARPIKYKVSRHQESGVASRTLIYSGGLLFFFVVFHLAHFTLGRVQPDLYHHVDELGRHDVYHMVVAGFADPVVSGVYIVLMVVLGFHLWHAIASLFQTLGWAHPGWRSQIEKLGKAVTVLVVLGNISIPLSVLLGIVRLPAGG